MLIGRGAACIKKKKKINKKKRRKIKRKKLFEKSKESFHVAV
jgi:hypothetical protein